MYGIIPAASPPDQSYGLAHREVVPRNRDGGVGGFAEQLSQLSSRPSAQSSDDEKAGIDAGDAGARSSSSDAEAKASESAATKRGRSKEQGNREAERKEEKTDSTGKSDYPGKSDTSGKADADVRDTVKSADSEFLRKKDAADQADHADDADIFAVIEGKLQKQKLAGRSRDAESDEAATSAGETAKAAIQAEHEKSGDGIRKAASRDAHRAEKAAVNGGQTSPKHPNDDGDTPVDVAKRTARDTADGDVIRTTKPNTTKPNNTKPNNTEPNTAKQSRLDSAPGETKNVEALVDRKEHAGALDRNRRIRAGEDPRERRLAAEKAGTKTLDAKAVSPVESQNTDIERTVTRELTVDLSQETTRQGDGGDGPESSLTVGRMEVSLGESSSRTPSLSQATRTLARRLNGELGDNIVRQAKVMLQDANHAELRLVIRPPELGRIRIRLQMENGHIAGRILVDNGSVREVVEQNLASLQRAFEETGLEMGDLEVSTGDARDDGETRDQGGNGLPHPPVTAGVESFGHNLETISEYEPGRHRINLVA